MNWRDAKSQAPPRGAGLEALIIVAFVCCVAAIGVLDYVTGPEIGFSLLYLIPIVISAWIHGRNASIAVALAAAISWFVADYLGRVSLAISLWNGITRLVIYLSQGILIATLREDRRREGVLARTDSVTRLANSRAFLEILENAARDPGVLNLLYLDLDHFKQVNDRFGHHRGDSVLEQTAGALRESIRSADVAARVGGDEFAVLIRDVDVAFAEAVGHRLLDRVRLIAAELEGTGFGASIGLASATGPFPAEELLRAADDAMYEAKRGRDGSVVTRICAG